jgi:tetratricopeptide (TPR) repeat protein
VQNNPKTGDYQSKLSAAEALLTKALIIQPSQHNVLVRYDRCLLRRAQARYEEALGFCRTLVDDLYRRPLAYKEMGMDYLYLGQPDQAISAFTTADHLVKRASARWTWNCKKRIRPATTSSSVCHGNRNVSPLSQHRALVR